MTNIAALAPQRAHEGYFQHAWGNDGQRFWPHPRPNTQSNAIGHCRPSWPSRGAPHAEPHRTPLGAVPAHIGAQTGRPNAKPHAVGQPAVWPARAPPSHHTGLPSTRIATVLLPQLHTNARRCRAQSTTRRAARGTTATHAHTHTHTRPYTHTRRQTSSPTCARPGAQGQRQPDFDGRCAQTRPIGATRPRATRRTAA